MCNEFSIYETYCTQCTPIYGLQHESIIIICTSMYIFYSMYRTHSLNNIICYAVHGLIVHVRTWVQFHIHTYVHLLYIQYIALIYTVHGSVYCSMYTYEQHILYIQCLLCNINEHSAWGQTGYQSDYDHTNNQWDKSFWLVLLLITNQIQLIADILIGNV